MPLLHVVAHVVELLLLISARHLLGLIPSLTKPSQVFLSLTLCTKLFLHKQSLFSAYKCCALIGERKVPAALTPLLELESIIFEQCQTSLSLTKSE